jgi:NDP-sugar pyrophosphorylase family protein
MTNPTLLVLAAGTGSRYRGMKINDPVGPNGETLMDYSIFDARRAGFGRIVFVIRPDVELSFKELVNARFGHQVPVSFVFQRLANVPSGFPRSRERTNPWGTTHAILAAANVIHEPFGVINADDFYGADSHRALASHLQSGSEDYALMGFVLHETLPEEGPVARAVCDVDESGYLHRVTEMRCVERAGRHARCFAPDGSESRLEGKELVSMNMWGFMPSVFRLLAERFESFLELHGKEQSRECHISESIDELLVDAKVKVKVLHSADSWFGLTYQDDHARVVAKIRRFVEDGRYPRKLWKDAMALHSAAH